MILENFKPIFKLLPEVKTPIHRQDFSEKLKWTAIVLVIYYFLAQIPLYGLSPAAVDQFAQLRAVMAGSFGSILTLGIGPIVTASIVLQLLVGAKILNLDLSQHEHKAMFQSTQKLLAILFTIFEAAVLVLTGSLVPIDNSFYGIMILQLVIGAILILYLDEVVSKWGFGSGVGLFIAAGVAQTIITGTFNFLPATAASTTASGILPAFIQSIIGGVPNFAILIPLIATIIVFLMAVYGESMRIEIPISHGQVRGHGRIRGAVGKYPLKFIYASNMPVILTSALLVNISLFASVFQKLGFPILGQVSGGRPISGLALWLTTPNSLSVLFTFRSSKRQLYMIMKKYIPALTILGGLFVGILAFIADLTGALGGGTGVLLTVGIVYKLYEEIAQEQLMEMHPMLRKVFE